MHGDNKRANLVPNLSMTLYVRSFYTLTLPTGAGKTITGLDIARKMAQKFGSKTIIYALPFISIVEQNSSVAKTIFGRKMYRKIIVYRV